MLSCRPFIERLEPRRLLAAGTGLQGEYFDNADLSAFKLTRTDATVDFNWTGGSPDAQIAPGTYSARWTGQIQARYTQAYTFYVTADDGARLWVNGQRLIDTWKGAGSGSASINLVAGRRYDIVLEYTQGTGNAIVRLEWSSASQAREVIPAQYLFPGKRGGLLREVFSGISGSTLASLTSNAAYPNSPTSTTLYSPAELPSAGDSYGQRLRGYVHAPVTGQYTFYIASDDESRLLISNSTDPAGARVIASVPGYTASREWTKYPQQRSVSIYLVAGQAYYIEALHKEGTLSDHLEIGWTLPGTSAVEVIRSDFLSPLLPTVKVYQLSTRMTEGSLSGARFQVSREGANIGSALTVYYTVGGTASASDYSALPGLITIPAGATAAEITVTSTQDTLVEGDETIVINLSDRPEYDLGAISTQSATAQIHDDDFAAPTSGVSAIAANPLTAFNVWGTGTSSRIVSVSGPTFTQALEITTTVQPASPWDIQAQQKNTIALNQGDAMVLEFYARATSGSGRMYAVVERAGTPYTKSLIKDISFGSAWTRYQFPFSMAEAYAVGGVNLALQLGFAPQTIQVADVRLMNYGPSASMLPTDTSTGWSGINTAYGTLRTIAVAGQPFARGFEVQTTLKPPSIWSLQALRPTEMDCTSGETLYTEFYARSATAAPAKVTAFLQRAVSPWNKPFANEYTLGSSWTLYRIPFTVDDTYAAGAASLGFFFGYDPQTVQIGGVKLVRVGIASPAISANPLSAFSTPNAAYGTSQVVSVTGAPGGMTEALEIVTTTVPPAPGDFRILQPTTVAVNVSDSVLLEFYARSTGTGNARFNVSVQGASSPYTASVSSNQTVGATWTLIRLPFGMAQAYAAGGANLVFDCGYGPQTLQIGRVRLVDVTQAFAMDLFPEPITAASYGGRDAASAWRTTAQTNIVQNRQAPITVNVTDQFGNPVDGVEVIIRQKQHAYAFGSALAGGLLINGTNADADTYRELARRLFNTAVIENSLKWPEWISARQLAIDSANWVVDNQMRLRGHNLIWPSRRAMPSSIWSEYDSIYAASGATAAANYLRDACMSHIVDEASTLAGLPWQWDVVNEPYANHDVMDILGNAVMLDWYNAAAAADPNAAMVLNDYGIFTNGGDAAHKTNFDNWINYLLTNGAQLDAIGEQSHYGGDSLPDLTQLQGVYDRFARFGLPITITEFDVNTTDEQLQADFLRDYFTFIFSQASSNGILQWGFWENAHWLPSAALYRSDWSIKPNGQQYEDLVFGDWWSDVRGTTLGGQFTSRVFQGDYEIIVQRYDTRVTQAVVGAAGTNITIALDVTAPVVSSFVINDGAVQRSMIRQITVGFSEDIQLDAGAFSLLTRSGGQVTDVTLIPTALDSRTYRITFTGARVTGDSLPDGMYRLVVSSAVVRDVAGNSMAANYTQGFHRLFGDSDGDRDVDGADLLRFRQAFKKPLAYNSMFDFDSDNDVDTADYQQFKLRLTTRRVIL